MLCAAAFVSHMISLSVIACRQSCSRHSEVWTGDTSTVLVANYSFRDKVSYEDAVRSLQDLDQDNTSDFRGQLLYSRKVWLSAAVEVSTAAPLRFSFHERARPLACVCATFS